MSKWRILVCTRGMEYEGCGC